MGEKDIDEEERQFLLTLGLVNQELRKRKFTQDSILCDNDHGVLVSFEGITLNYNLPAFDQNKEQYLQEQEEKHDKYLRKIQNHRLGIKNDLARLTEKDSLLAAKISKDDIQEKIKETAVKIAFDILYKQSARLGKYFFEARRDENQIVELKPLLEKLVGLTYSIYKNAEELERVDREHLEFLEKMQKR